MRTARTLAGAPLLVLLLAGTADARTIKGNGRANRLIGTSSADTILGRAGNDWADQAGRWHAIAQKQHKTAWVMEAQAEPWEASATSFADPRSFHPSDMIDVFNGLKEEGFTTILLWGAEYWLWRADNGDSSWLDAVQGLLHQNLAAPSLLGA